MGIVTIIAAVATVLAVLLALHRTNRLRTVPAASAALAAIAVASGVMLTGQNAAAASFNVTVLSSDVEADPPVIELDGMTYADARDALEEEDGESASVVLDGVTGASNAGTFQATLTTDDDEHALALTGDATVAGQDTTVLVSANWEDGDATNPDLAVILRYDSVDLGALNSGWDQAPVELGPALIGISNGEHTLSPSSTLGTDTILDDGIDGTDDDMEIPGNGVELRAVVTSGALAEAAQFLGATGEIRLRGTLAGSLDVLGDDAGSFSGDMELAADLAVDTPGDVAASGVTFTSPWTLDIAANTDGDLEASMNGGASIDFGDGTQVDFSASLGISYSAGDGTTTIEFVGEAGTIENLFDQQWLDLQGVTVTLSATSGGSVNASVEAELSIGEITADAAIALSADTSTGETSVTLDLTATSETSIAGIVEDFGVDGDVPDELSAITITDLGLHISATTGGTDGTQVTAAVNGAASLFADACGEGSAGAQAQMLFRVDYGSSGSPELLIGAGVSGLTLQQLSCDIPFDWTLPDGQLLVSTQEVATDWGDLDGPTQSFFCPDGEDCPDTLEVAQGVTLRASINFEDDMQDALESVGINVEGPLEISGKIPAFGGTETELSVSLPEVQGGADDMVESGTVAFTITQDTGSVEASIEGSMVFRITRPDQTDCSGADGNYSNGDCYDTVNLSVEASVSAGTDGVAIELAGELSNWDNAFGQSTLTVNTFRLQLGIETTPTGVGLTIGLRGNLEIERASDGDVFDLELAIAAKITPNPPWITITGFTFGTGRGFSVQDIVTAFAPDADAADVPSNLSLKDIWLSYGVETDTDLCIRQGLYISAEIHMNDANPDSAVGDNPICGTDVDENNDDRSCTPGHDSCLAAIEIDISPERFKVYGALNGFTAGPIESGGLELLIDISPTDQTIYFKGSATLYDPVAYATPPVGTENVWASGFLRFDLQQSGGTLSVGLTGCALVGGTSVASEDCPSDDGQLLLAYLDGSLLADFTKVGPDFFESAQASFDVRLSSPALEKLAEDIEEGMEDVAKFFEDAGETLEGEAEKVIDDIESTFCTTFDPDCSELQVTADSYDAAPAYIEAEINATDSAIHSSAALDLHCFGTFDWPVHECVDGYRDSARATNNAFIANRGGASYIALHGINATGWGGLVDSLDTSHYWVNPTHFQWPAGYPANPALCDEGGELEGNAICNAGQNQLPDYDELAGEVLHDVLEEVDPSLAELAENGGLSFGADSLPQSTGLDHSQFLSDIRELGESFDSGTPLGMCAATTQFQYFGDGDAGASSTSFSTKTSAFSSKVEFPVELDGASFDRDAVHQAIIAETLTSDVNDLNCPTEAGQPTQSDFSFEMSSTEIDEGDALTLTGTAAANEDVEVTWGDGSESLLTANSAGEWTIGHVYEDGPAFHVVQAGTANDNAAASLMVNNVAPTIDSANLPAESDEGDTITFDGSFGDPGVLDSHTLTVEWGDGSGSDEVTFAADDDRSFSLDHRYRDDSQDYEDGVYTVTLNLEDKDGGEVEMEQEILVHNVAPYDLTLDSAIDADGETATTDPDDGNIVVEEGETMTFRGTFRDPGVDDEHTIAFNFGDGDQFEGGVEPGDGEIIVDEDAPGLAQGETWRDEDDENLVHYEVVYTFADDEPTATVRDLMEVQAEVEDGDGGVGNLSTDVWVENVAPDVAATPSSHDVQYSDPVDQVTLTATDVRGYVDGDSGSWSETLEASTRWNIDGGAWSDGLPADLSLSNDGCELVEGDDAGEGSASRQECTWTVDGIANVAPGTYTIEFSVEDDDTAVSITSVVVEIEPEDAEARYNGPTIVSSPDLHDGSMDVELRAVVRDITAVGEDHPLWDDTAGDIANADVTFVDADTGNTLCYAEDVNYVFDGNEQVGVATCTASFDTPEGDLETLDVRLVVGGWYTNERSEAADTEFTVQRPGGDFTIGGGINYGDGTPALYGDGGRTTVQFGVRWGMRGYDLLRGNTRLRFDADGTQYQLDVTSYDSLGVLPVDGAVDSRANIEARATLRDQSGWGRGTVVAEDLRLQMWVTDYGRTSEVAYALWANNGRLLFASSWDGDFVPEGPWSSGSAQVYVRPN